jgi:hypothetical protein
VNDSKILEAHADSDGRFVFHELSVGAYILTGAASGFAKITKSIDVGATGALIVDLQFVRLIALKRLPLLRT